MSAEMRHTLTRGQPNRSATSNGGRKMHGKEIHVLTDVPDHAVVAVLRYRTSDGAKAKIYLFEGDQSPQVLHGPDGTVRVNCPSEKKFILEKITDANWDFTLVRYHESWERRASLYISTYWEWLSRTGASLAVCTFLIGVSVTALYWMYAKPATPDYLKFISSVAPLLAVVVTIFALVMNVKHNRFSMGVNLLKDLHGEFESDEMKKVRARAATTLRHVSSSIDSNVDHIIDFFEGIALLERRGAIDAELIWHSFYYWFTCYYDLTIEYRAFARRIDPTQWEDIERLSQRMIQQQHRHAARTLSPFPTRQDPVTDAQRDFLADEIRSNPLLARRRVKGRARG